MVNDFLRYPWKRSFVMVASSSAHFVCLQLDGKWVVTTKIFVLEGMVSKGDGVTLGVGRDAMGPEGKPK